MRRHPPLSTLFPYTTLFRSHVIDPRGLDIDEVAFATAGHPIGREVAPIVQRRISRSEEHTSELQSRLHLVCRLLLEKKKKNDTHIQTATHTPMTIYTVIHLY